MKAATTCTKCRDNFPLPEALDYFDRIVIEDYTQRRTACTAVPNAAKPCLQPAPAKRPVLRTCVIYTKDGTEHRTAWFSSRERARQALAIIQSKCGNGVLFID